MDSSSIDPSVSKEPKSRETRQKESLESNNAACNTSNVNVPITAAVSITVGRNEAVSTAISEEKNLNNSNSASVDTEVPKPKTRRRHYNRGKKGNVNIEPKSSTNADKSENEASTSIAANPKITTKNTNETGAKPKTKPVTNRSERSQTKKFNSQNGITDQVPSTSQSVKQKNKSNTKPKRQHQYNVRKGLTPYQGYKQVFGTFKCDECSTKWTSNCSFADIFQYCKKCRAKVYPFKQPLTEKEEEEYLDSMPELQCYCEITGGPPCKDCREDALVMLKWIMMSFMESTTLVPNSEHQSK